MNLSIPIIICDENEEVRRLIKEMLIKNGFFHLVEAHTREEVTQLTATNHFIIIHKKLLDENIKQQILRTKHYLIVAQNDDEDTAKLSAVFGVKHLISFPYTSRVLVEKINSLLS